MVTLLALAIITTLLLLSGHFSASKFGQELISEEMNNYTERHNLQMSRTFIRNNWGLLLDQEKSKLLYISVKADRLNVNLIDLHKVRSCSILNTYTTPSFRFLFNRKIQKGYIDCVSLKIKQRDDSICQIPFYNYRSDKWYEMKMLVRQARHWQRIIQQ
jgi:hypothetical protein